MTGAETAIVMLLYFQDQHGQEAEKGDHGEQSGEAASHANGLRQ